MIEARQLSAKQGNTVVFENLNLTLHLGEMVSLLGPNGCGKTTLLRTLLALHPKETGQVLWQGEAAEKLTPKVQSRLVSYVPQYHRLAFGYEVIEMVLMGVMAGYSEWARPTQAQRELAQNALEMLNIGNLSDRPYTQLSGGQRQLVLIARALAQDTPYIFLDEPTNGLDYGNQLKLLDKIQSLANQKRCILMTTHHPEHALMVSNRVITLQDGLITEDGHPDEVIHQASMAQLYDLSPHHLTRLPLKAFHVEQTD